MPLITCPHCSSDFGSGAGLASHNRARKANGGQCGDSRQRKINAANPTIRTPTSTKNEWKAPVETEIPTPARLLPKRKLADTIQVPLPSGEEQAKDLHRMKDDHVAPVHTLRADSAMPPSEPSRLGTGRPSERMITADPDIRDVPPGEQGVWQIDPVTKKRKLSTLTGLPILDRASRDFVIHEARRYAPWELGPDGKLL